MTEVLGGVFGRVGVDGPDGRPLYAYRLTPDEAVALRQHVQSHLSSSRGRTDGANAGAFCLWAADYFRRAYVGGGWTWDTVLDEIDGSYYKSGSGYLALQRMVEDGLRWWRRPLLRGASRREFLVTIGCEGGLPLHLVQREGNALRRYFRSLLRHFQAHSYGGRLFDSVRPEDLARRAADGVLGTRLQQQVIFQLAADLVTVVLGCAEHLADARAEPLMALDARSPGWRERLPLHLDDDQAQAFIAGLLQDAVISARSETSALRWLRRLEGARNQGPDGRWILRGQLEFSSEHTLQEFKSVFGGIDVPSRGKLRVRFADETTRDAARVMQTHREDTDWLSLYRMPTSAGSPTSALVAATVAIEIESASGRCGPSASFAGGMALSADLPWIFADEAEGERASADFAGEGSTNVRAAAALVVLPAGWAISGDGASSSRELGHLADIPGLRVVRVCENVHVTGPQGERCSVRLNAPTFGIRAHRLLGEPLVASGSQKDAFLGLPSLYEREGEQPERVVPKSELRWRSSLPGAHWVPLTEQILGEGTVRRVVDGEVLFSARVCVLPKKLVHRVIPQSATEGVLLINGLAGADVAFNAIPGVAIESDRRSPESLQLRVTHGLATPPGHLHVVLHWGESGRAEIQLPFPVRLARFERVANRASDVPITIAASTLSAYHAVVIGPSGKDRTASIEGVLRGGPGENDVGFIRRDLQELAPSHARLSLDAVGDEVGELLSSTEQLDAHVLLKLDGGTGDIPTLKVTRYDLRLEADRSGVCRIAPEDWQRLTGAERDSLRLVAFPISDPGVTAVPLDRMEAPDHSILSPEWRLPQNVEPKGSWMVFGLDGGWSRLRPRLVVAEPVPEYLPGGLASACALLDDVARGGELQRVLARLAEDPAHSDWSMMHQFVRRTADLPASAFSALREIARIPRAASMLLFLSLREPEGSTEQTLRALESLPFAWEAIPSDVYAGSWRCLVRQVLEEFGGDAPLAALYLDGLSAALPRWLQFLTRVMTYRELTQSAPPDLKSQLARDGIDAAGSEMRAVALDRLAPAVGAAFCKVENLYSECSKYADGFNPAQLVRPAVRIAFAPAIAALAATAGAELSPLARYQLRRVVSRYPDAGPAVFEAAYRYGLLRRWSQRS